MKLRGTTTSAVLGAVALALQFSSVSGRAVDYSRPLSTQAGGINWGWSPAMVDSTPPYNLVGAVLTDDGQGSGCAVARHIVLTAGHMMVDSRGNWVTGILWSRARSSSNKPSTPPAVSYVNTTYQSRIQQGTDQNATAAFSEDWAFLAFYDDSAGNGYWVDMAYDYFATLDAGGFAAAYEVVGYPAGRYRSPTDIRQDEMHSTNPSMTYTQFRRGRTYYLNGAAYAPDWFESSDLYTWGGNSGGPVFTMAAGRKLVCGILVSGSNFPVTSGAREVTSSLGVGLALADEAFRSWVSTPVAAVKTRSPVRVHQGWSQAFTIGADGKLQCTFFNGSYWQTYSMGGQVLDSVGAPFDLDRVGGMVWYLAGGDLWVAYPTSAGWAHLRVLDYGPGLTGTPVAVSYDSSYRVVGVHEASDARRMVYFTGQAWASFPIAMPAGRISNPDGGTPITWDYKKGGGLVGRYFYGGWMSVDTTANLGGVLPGDGEPTTTPDGKLAGFAGGVAYASRFSTLELMFFWYSSWVRASLLTGIDSRSWVASDRARNRLFCVDTGGHLVITVPGTTSWQRTTTSIPSTADSAGAVAEAYGALFHASGGTLSVCWLR